MEKFYLHAQVHGKGLDKMMDIVSVGNFQNELSEETTAFDGSLLKLYDTFKAMKTPAPMNFSWRPSKHFPASLFTSLKTGHEFTFELRVQIRDQNKNLKGKWRLNFYSCKYQKSYQKNGKIKVEATYNSFD